MATSRPKTIVVIPARGGSKGVPKKNLRLLAQKPLIAYPVEAALQANTIDAVFVSTDDSEIAAISEKFGANVIHRPPEISGDTASSESALLHALMYFKGIYHGFPEHLVFLQCTSPLVTSADIDGAVRQFEEEKADCCFGVSDFHYFLWEKEKSGEVQGVNHNPSVRPMRQTQRNQYVEAGNIYVVRVEGFLEHRHRFFGKKAMFKVPREKYLEIDDEIDFQIAEAMLKNLRNKGEANGD